MCRKNDLVCATPIPTRCTLLPLTSKYHIDETLSMKHHLLKEDEMCCKVLKVIFSGPKRNPKNLFLGVFWIISLQLTKLKTLSENHHNPLK